MMKTIITSVIMSFLLAISCCAFFGTLLPKRQFRHLWIGYSVLPAFFADFLIIAFTPIPPYILQPVRLILILFLTVMVFYQADIFKKLTASILFCGIYWLISIFLLSLIPFFPFSLAKPLMTRVEEITECLFLALMLLFYFKCKNRFSGLESSNWTRFYLFPLLGLVFMVSIAMTSWDGSTSDAQAKLAAILCFVIINGCLIYFISDLIKKEKEVQQLQLVHERTLSQMYQYRNAQKTYEQQRRQLHDYKNQLDCIQGLLKAGKDNEALSYISGLTGSIRKNTEYINTKNPVVNVVLNQKYQEACEKGIAMFITVNDLSTLPMREEQIVSLLGNLLDNAMEACSRLNQDSIKVIYFKMVLEDEQLILSTRNPVNEPMQIKNNSIQTQKQDTAHHGIGLLNIDAVIKSCRGTSVLKCESGWFCFSAMLPL